ncbi:transposable element Tc1 transposase [Trichonephila clavipes]|nr:transposable element Tc1 transposase [Trichonephila clavipes]
MNPDSISAVMTIVFVCGDPVVNASILPLLHTAPTAAYLESFGMASWASHEFERTRGKVTAIWNEMSQDIIQNFYVSMPNRLTSFALEGVQQEYNAYQHTARVAIDYLAAYQTFPWPVRSPDVSPIEHVWHMMGWRLHLPENVDDHARQLKQIWQETPQETIRVLYHFMPRRVAACLHQTRGGSTPYRVRHFVTMRL